MDLELIIERILVFEDHVEVKLRSDIDAILRTGEAEEAANFKQDTGDISQITIVQTADRRSDKVFHVNVISSGERLP